MTTTYTYDRADQLATQVISGTTKSYDYDRYGNLLSAWDNVSSQTTYAYDEANRLKTISPPGGAGTQVTFTLDALDRHLTRAVGGTTSDNYGYVGATETAWQVGNATTTGSLLDADGSRLAVKTGSTVSWLLFDLHGSVAAVCPAGSTSLSDAYRYDGFGQQIASSGSVTNPWRYRGLLNMTSDFGVGALLDMGARDYAPQLGVFTQEDSVQGGAANPMTMNRFLYALANPATLVDPDGHLAILDEGDRAIPVSNDLPTRGPATAISSIVARERDRACGFAQLNCRSDPGAMLAGLSVAAVKWAGDTVVGVGKGVYGLADNLVCEALIGCGIARERERLEAAQQFDAMLAQYPGGGIQYYADQLSNGAHDLDQSIFHAPSGFLGAQAAGYTALNVAATVVPVARGARMLGMAGDAAELSLTTARQAAADAAAAGSGSGRGMAAAIARRSNVLATGLSGTIRGPLNPIVQAILDRIPQAVRSLSHGKCAEVFCISQLLDNGIDVRGAASAAVGIGGPGRQGLPFAPCASCQILLDELGVKY